jgi:Domain of unknown function (DUF397)
VTDADTANLAWRRAAACQDFGCVEVATLGPDGVALRDSKNPSKGAHVFDAKEWAAFITGVKAGEFDFFPA